MSQPRVMSLKMYATCSKRFLSLTQTSVRAEMEMNRGVVHDLEVPVSYYFYGPRKEIMWTGSAF